MSKRILLAVAAFAVVVLAGCTTSDDNGDEVQVVEMQGVEFSPDDVTVEAGTTVMWRNVDSQVHNVVALDEDADWSMSSGELLDGGERHEYTFTEPGTYEYRCEPHSSVNDAGECNGMCATLTVEAADEGADDGTE